MASESVQNGDGVSSPDDVEALKKENATLREKLAKATSQAAEYRKAAYEMLDDVFPCTFPTEEEIQEILHGPRGRSPFEMIEEYERRFLRGQE